MSTQYNLVADQYDLSFQISPFRLHIEAFSTFQLLGNVTDHTILEVATGTGYYARAMRRQGAARVIGVDIAEQMIQIARMAEQAEAQGIEYHVQDITQFESDTVFDLALAIYLLHYAPTLEVLNAMCQAVARHLKSGGRFVTYQLNPDLAREPGYYEVQPGMSLRLAQAEAVDGEPVPFTVRLGDMVMPEITAYRWDKTTLETALTAAGFTDIRWIMPQLSPAGAEQYGQETFAAYLKQPHAVLMECIKQ